MGSLKCSLNGKLLATARARRRRASDRSTGETGAVVSVVDGLAKVVVGCVLGTIVVVEPWTSGAVDVVVPAQRSCVVIPESDVGAAVVAVVVAGAWELSRDKNETQQPWKITKALALRFSHNVYILDSARHHAFKVEQRSFCPGRPVATVATVAS